ncbi:hypothetical protein HYS97_01335 [Candidatus Daviesbacteria bacterium]|nr:hypothetical protein [Candidatus Daviesbacteria bacterium]
MKQIGDILEKTKGLKRPKNLSKEFQFYGVYLAEELGDLKHYSLYIKLAKEVDRVLLDEALTFTKGYLTAKNKARVFMWRLKQLKDEKRAA